jgi:hypothetical protein
MSQLQQVGKQSEFCFFGHSTVAMTTHTPQEARKLLAVHSDIAKTLTVVALCKPIFGYISFDLYNLQCVVNLKISGAF